MLAIYVVLSVIFLGFNVHGAPTASLDAKTLLQNGEEAQALNAEFATLKVSDACDDGEMACIKNSIAHCANSTWQLETCPKPLSCFALPSVRDEGVTLSCTSNLTALSVINASGATGGIFSNTTDTSVDLPMDCNGDDQSDDDTITNSGSASSSPTGTQKAKASASTSFVTSTSTVFVSPTDTSTSVDDSGASTITVTVTVAPPLPSDTNTTLTLQPSQASSILSSILNDPNASATTIINSASLTTSASASATTASSTGSATDSQSSNDAPTGQPAVGSATLFTIHRTASTTTAATSSASPVNAAASSADSVYSGY